ncbi:unnamed protein product [Linum tenue]|uniref:Nucleotide-diphospho-sugar transferase domain-containing protein n=1 Tax=Linum tenue TaxID=586396 RepID=A0AAV0NZ67_9ROSI|nr:unnamed protein product [Linum tenue]
MFVAWCFFERFLGTPFFHSMVERSHAFDTDIIVFVDSQTVLLPDLVPTLSFAHKLDRNWLLAASLQDTSFFPFKLGGDGQHWLRENGRRLELDELQELLGQNRHCEDRSMLMAWNSRNVPLQNGVLPPFLFGKGIHNHWRVNEGLPVFHDPSAPSNISFNDCHFGTKCFQKVTKVKSRIVLQILKMGYNVLLSDVDVYWFENPLQYVRSFGPTTLVAQSDEYNQTGPINLPRRLNSGFYFARSNAPTIAAIEKVVNHASTSTLSEQPSFYDMLSGTDVFELGDCRLAEMVTGYCCLLDSGKKSRRRKHELTTEELTGGGVSVSLEFSANSNDVSVRIVHPGGKEESFQYALSAQQVMEKYPGTHVARQDVFQNPEDSILWPEENLLPGNKYLIIPSTTAEKLKHHRKHHRHHGTTTKERLELCDTKDTRSGANITWDEQDISEEENVCRARDFYASKDMWSRCSERKTRNVRSRKRQPFIPPLPRSRSFKGLSWEPSLTSVQELSP